MSRAGTPSAIALKAPAPRAAVSWPGLTPATSQEFSRIGRGLPVSEANKYAQRQERYYHILDYATGGATLLTFFNVGATDGVCNLNQGEVPNERPFWLHGLSVTWQDFTAAGARSGKQLDGAAITSIARAEEVRTILQAGLLKIQVGDRPIFEAQDLTHFPSDGGFYVSAGFVSYASATAGSIAPFNNGEPIAGNRFEFRRPWPVLPGKRIRIDLSWLSALSVTTAGRIKIELIGESVVPLNA